MTEPTTVNVALIIPNTGDLVGTWGSTALNPDLSAVDGFLGGVQTISLSNANVTLTSPPGSITPSPGPTQSQNAVLRLTGVLTGSVIIFLPLPGTMLVENLTTGNFTVTMACTIGTEIVGLPQGECSRIYNDGSRVRFAGLPNVGSYLDICDSVVPSWINACTIPPYLNCDGTTFNATTYPYLNQRLGGNVLPDLRGVARYTLNQGTSRLTSAGSGLDGNTLKSIKTTQSYTVLTANLPPYTPSGTIVNGTITSNAITGGSVGSGPNSPGAVPASTPLATFTQGTSTFNGTSQGGTSTPFGLVATGTVAGITLIRAA